MTPIPTRLALGSSQAKHRNDSIRLTVLEPTGLAIMLHCHSSWCAVISQQAKALFLKVSADTLFLDKTGLVHSFPLKLCFATIQEFSDLPRIIQEASRLMGLRGFSEFADAPTFAADVLRLELVGNTGLHLTLVDLPGLISVSEDDGDVEMVQSLVDSYLESSRTIILAVIPASSDAETQRIIQRARHFDKDGVRTIGIITKPDLINKDTEETVARLAKNLERTRVVVATVLNADKMRISAALWTVFRWRRWILSRSGSCQTVDA